MIQTLDPFIGLDNAARPNNLQSSATVMRNINSQQDYKRDQAHARTEMMGKRERSGSSASLPLVSLALPNEQEADVLVRVDLRALAMATR